MSAHPFAPVPHLLPLIFVLGMLACGGRAMAQEEESSFLEPVVFFPPTPPIIGAPIANQATGYPRSIHGRRMTPPDGMAAFVAEPFYPALSTRLFVPKLSKSIEVRLHAYRTSRDQETSLLLNQLGPNDAATDSIDEAALRAFAAEQTPRLAALELEAERLRVDLISDWFWRNRIDWNNSRRWKLDPRKGHTDAAEAEAQFQVVRAAAYYQAGLLPAQRGLLRELAIELQDGARRARGQPGNRADSDAIFFSPETTRFRLPPNASPRLRERLGAYNGRKAVLKRELHDTVIAQDRAGGSSRATAYEALADKQWPEIVALEQLAEEMRTELSGRLTPAPPPAPPWVPARLIEEIHSYNADREVYFTEMKLHADQAAAQVPHEVDDEGGESRFRAKQVEVRRAAMLEFRRLQAERYDKLELRYKGIRESLSIISQNQVDRKTGQPLNADTLLRVHSASLAEFDTFGRESVLYTHYRIAMLQPGLSPEQRRLLFGYALMGLAQPLPYGEVMPQSTAKRPYATP